MATDKLSIVAYKTNKYTGKSIGKVGVKINPASYSHKHQVNYCSTIPTGAANTPLKFSSMPPETISFDIHFDATGAIPNNTVLVETQLKQFKKVCFNFNGQIHEPNYLIVSWGSLVFKCKLTSLSVNYTLFKKDGTPLRAKASVSFQEAIDETMINKIANKRSPDLTHYVVVKAGDTLPLLCHEIYGDQFYYMEVAKHNNIANFRNLTPGTKLYMPPLK
ncbi:MAG: hypothetical protein CMC15_06690 [Flavobacteriaceae bacterium]|jgi:hypothetical protein|nr:hypothetical protein [Flavobacteriaceae bacterium]|tara:strand:- start:46058 stop:46714 length:657 start_codon:yes stop_codon:yes gene_type:complete